MKTLHTHNHSSSGEGKYLQSGSMASKTALSCAIRSI